MNKLYLLLCLLSILMYRIDSFPTLDIINGEVAKDEIKFTVSIYCDTEFLGAGLVINDDWVVTVAHLFFDLDGIDMENLFIGYGSNNLDQQMKMKIVSVHQHAFNITKRIDDIALVKVPGIGKKINFDVINLQIEDASILHDYTLVGWGQTNIKTQTLSNQLQSTRLGYVKFDQCAHIMLDMKKRQLGIEMNNKSSFCLVGRFTHACYGDSGSPVFTVANNQTIAYGLTSWGKDNCEVGFPVIFTKLYHFLPFINEIMSKH